jgi:RNase P protein component
MNRNSSLGKRDQLRKVQKIGKRFFGRLKTFEETHETILRPFFPYSASKKINKASLDKEKSST